ncbi:MAG TPA: hypothetical protein P5137_16070, partial [Candidatus Brocadiia bacterium]|nr:hypothetical protein [Candidatus Brocadiia bacterium]
IRVCAVEEAVDARRPLSHLSDGLATTGWPHPTYGASSSGREVELIFRNEERFNHVEVDVFRGFAGSIEAVGVESGGMPKTPLAVPADRMAWRGHFDMPARARALRIRRDDGRIGEVRAWEVLDGEQLPDVSRVAGQKVFRPAGALDTEEIRRSLAHRAARQASPARPRGWALSQKGAGAQAALDLAPLEPVVFISEPQTADLCAGAVSFRFDLEGVKPGAVMRVEFCDPVWPTRRLFMGDFRLEGASDGSASLDVDLPDFFVAGRPAGEAFPRKGGKEAALWLARQPLRLMAVATMSHATRLKDFTLTVHETDRAKAIAGQDRTQLPFVREGYADSSEARAYAWHPIAYEKLFFTLWDFNLREPDRPEIKAVAARVGLRDDPLKVAMPPDTPGVPRWAALQLRLLKRCRALCHYWIRERELPNGEVGGGLGDDTDFKDDWVNLALISDDDGRIADSVRRLAETAWTRDGMDRGYQLHLRDGLHAIEEGADLQPHMLHLYPGNPVYQERVMEMCQHLWEWMDVTPATGKLHFKSWWVGGKGGMRTDLHYGVDRDYCGYFTMGPAFFVWKTGHPKVAERLRTWCESWLSYLDERDAKGRPLGLPWGIEWKTGKPVGARLNPKRGDRPPAQFFPAFVCAYEQTKDRKFLALHRMALEALAADKGVSIGAWTHELWRLGSDADRAAIRKETLKRAWRTPQEAEPVNRDPNYAWARSYPQYLAWLFTRDKGYLEVGLAEALAFMDEQYP